MSISRQNGQAIVFIIIFLGVLALAIAYTFNAAQVVNEKTRLQNTVDAAAYSVATVEARDLNFKALTNRAMVANQVAIAQAVSLTSWIRFLDNTARNLQTVAGWIPVVGQIISAVKTVVANVKSVMEPVLRGAATAIDAVISILNISQQSMHAATTLVAEETFKKVVEENDPDVDIGASLNQTALFADYLKNHANFTRVFDPDVVRNIGARRTRAYNQNRSRMEEFRGITVDSVDGFVNSRNDDIPVPPTPPIPPVQFEFRRAGGTSLVGENSNAMYGSWIAMDTLSFYRRTYNFNPFNLGWRGWREFVPVGWGAAKNARGAENIRFTNFTGSGFVGNSWGVNPRGSRFAASEFQSATEVEMGMNYLGLRSFYDLTLDGLMTYGPGVKLLISKPSAKIKTTTTLGYNYGKADIEEKKGMSSNRLSAISKSVPYFARVNDISTYSRASQVREYGNLYNPYWQAKLEPVSDTEKLMLQEISKKL